MNIFIPIVLVFISSHGCSWSHKPHPSLRKERSGHAATIKLLLRQKLDVTSQNCTLHRFCSMSYSSSYVTMCLADVGILLFNSAVSCDNSSAAA